MTPDAAPTIPIEVRHPEIRRWERVYRLEMRDFPGDRTLVLLRYFSRGLWYETAVTTALEEDLGPERSLGMFLARARAFAFRFRTLGPKGRLP